MVSIIEKYTIRFFFDAGSGTCLWSGDEATKSAFKGKYFIELSKLPVDHNVRIGLIHLVAWYDTILDWNDPGGPTRWDAVETDRFNAYKEELLEKLRSELGPEYRVIDESTI